MSTKQPSYSFSAWRDYEDWESTCRGCKWTGTLSLAIFEPETDLVSSLRCPTCDQKLALLQNEATLKQIRGYATRGSTKAIEHLRRIDAPSE